jgi:hypothetical protein
MSLIRSAHELRAAVHIFMSRIDYGEVNAAPASGLGHEFVIPEPSDADDGLHRLPLSA